MLSILESLPDEILHITAHELYQVLSGPSLVHLSGKRKRPLFVSVLLHGNETTGFFALQRLLKKYQGKSLPRALSIFFGNVEAARYQLRCLKDGPDYNRVWSLGDSAESRMMQRVLEEMKQRKIFLSIDIHNNTGLNPHYACVNRLQNDFFQIARLFSRTVVYFTRPLGVQSMAFANLCPSVTVECGHIEEKSGVDHAFEFLEACLHLSKIPKHKIAAQDIDLFHTVAIVKVPQDCSFSFGQEPALLQLRPDLDHLNFRELSPKTLLGSYNPGSTVRLNVFDNQGREVGDQFLIYEHGKISTKVSLMPSMFTLNQTIVKQDCLGYLMKRMEPVFF